LKILLLTCNTGEGHNSASAAIQDVCAQRGISCDTADALSFLSEKVSRVISRWHVRIYRHMPKLFCSGYGFAENHPSIFNERRLICRYLSTGVNGLRAHLMKGQYDAVLCVHVFPALMMTELIRRYPLNIQTAFVSTDYTCSPITGDTDLNLYFVPHGDLLDEFESNGLPRDRLIPTGIPVRRAFCQPPEKAAARAELGLTQSRQIVLMCGSMGCGPMGLLSEEISAALPPDTGLNVICGTNAKLARTLTEKALPGVQVIHYTQKMAAWLAAADLFLTKPGGLSISEAATVGVPMLFLDTVGGCEARNLKFFTDHGWAQAADSAKSMAEYCCGLIQDSSRLEERRTALRQTFCQNSASAILDTLCARNEHFREDL
jgi:processive 1,2-diacylglycerol beta-glucosyltransferase